MPYDPFDLDPYHNHLRASSGIKYSGCPRYSYNPNALCSPQQEPHYDPFNLCNPRCYCGSKSGHPQQEHLNRIYGARSYMSTSAVSNGSSTCQPTGFTSNSSSTSDSSTSASPSSNRTKRSFRISFLNSLNRRNVPRHLPRFHLSKRRSHHGYIRASSPSLSDVTTLLPPSTPLNSSGSSQSSAVDHSSPSGACNASSSPPFVLSWEEPAPHDRSYGGSYEPDIGECKLKGQWDAQFSLDWTRDVFATSLRPLSPSSWSSFDSRSSDVSQCEDDEGLGSDGQGDFHGDGEDGDGWSFQCRGYEDDAGSMLGADAEVEAPESQYGSDATPSALWKEQASAGSDKWRRQLGL